MEKISQKEWNSSKKSVDLSTGIKMKYIETGSKEGKVIILLHGYADSSRTWSIAAPYLSNNYHLYILDQRGFGDTSKPDMRTYPLALYAEDVKAFMNALHIAKASVIGHSMGSFVARFFAATYPELIDKLVLVSTTLTMANTELTSELWEIISKFESNPIDMKIIDELFEDPIIDDEDFTRLLKFETSNIPANVWKAVLRGLNCENHSACLKDIKAPIMILWGELDPLFPEKDQKEIKKALPQAKFVVFPGGSHCINYEQAEKTADIIREFLLNA